MCFVFARLRTFKTILFSYKGMVVVYSDFIAQYFKQTPIFVTKNFAISRIVPKDL